ncbi:MAG: hypothetical protein GX053_10595 [Tissierella sp.]|nr:hypothetical protein [Tissierella sp.]
MSDKINNINKASNKNIMLYFLFLLLIILPQYFKGGYFESAYLPFILGISILMIFNVWNRYKGIKESLVKDETDLLLLGLVLIYSLTFFYGINKRGSIIEFIKNTSYLSVFFIARDLHKDNSIRNKTIDLIILSGIILSIIGVGTMIGTWEYNASYNGGRLSSTFQYPNTLAVYVAAMYFLTMGQALIEANPKKIGLYGGGMFVFFSTLIFTYSRGMWVLFPILLLGFFTILASNKKVELFFYSLGNITIAVPVSFLLMKYVESGSPTTLWGLYIGGIVLSALILFVLGNATKLLNKISWKTVIVMVLIIAVGAVGVLLLAIRAGEPLIYENQTDERVVSQLSRTIKNVFPNTDYELNIKGSATLEEEGTFAGSILVYSVDEQIQYTSLGTYNIEENGEFDLNIPITTVEDTNAIVIRFRNENPNTSVVFNESAIKDVMTEEIEVILLKYRYIPESVVSRISGIGTADNSFQARVIFSKDALKLVSNRLLFGLGGQGWATAYRSVQSYPYWSNQVHNHYLQQFVEVGLVGVLLFIGFLLTLIYKYFLYKKNEEDIDNRTFVDTLVIGIGTVLAHAAMDFDLSYVGLMSILWTLLGILHSIVSIPKDELKIFKLNISKRHLKKMSILAAILITITLGLSSSLYGASFMSGKAVKEQSMGNTDEMEKAMEKAVSLDPYNKIYRADLMDIYFFQYEAKLDESYGYDAKVQADILLKQGKYDPLIHIEMAQAYFKFGLVEEALNLINKSNEMQPLITDSYIQNIDSHLSAFDYYFNQDDLQKARELAIEGSNKLETLLLESSERSIRPLAKDNKLYFKLSELKYYANHFDEFIFYLDDLYDLRYAYDFNLDVDNDGNIELVSIWNADGGELHYESHLADEEYIRLINPGENYGVFDSVGFNLEPETTYLVTFDARGDMTPDKVSFYTVDTESQEQLQSESTSVNLQSDWNTFKIEFTTQGDIGEDTSRFRFVISGETEGYMDLRNIKIFEKIN